MSTLIISNQQWNQVSYWDISTQNILLESKVPGSSYTSNMAAILVLWHLRRDYDTCHLVEVDQRAAGTGCSWHNDLRLWLETPTDPRMWLVRDARSRHRHVWTGSCSASSAVQTPPNIRWGYLNETRWDTSGDNSKQTRMPSEWQMDSAIKQCNIGVCMCVWGPVDITGTVCSSAT